MKESIFKKNKYSLFVGIVAIVCILGSVLCVSLAYLSGAFKEGKTVDNPYLGLEFIYNNSTISGEISGTIGADGSLTQISVGSTNITGTTSGSDKIFNMPIYIKNTGNIDGKLINLMAYFEFFDGVEKVTTGFIDYDDFNERYFIQIVPSSTNFNIQNNSSFVFSDKVIASGETLQIIDSLNVSGLDESDLCGYKFVLHFVASLGQDNIDEINASI